MKCWCVEWLSCNQKPSHLTDLEGVIISPLREMGRVHLGFLSRGERQWMKSVLGTEKPRFKFFAQLEITLNILWRMRMLVR